MLGKVSLYILGSLMLLISGVIFFISGVYFLVLDYSLFLDWEILSLNSCSVMMTFIFDWISLIFLGCVFVISSMVVYYSESYMGSDVYKARFYFLVLMFVLSMMMMIVSPNLMSILIGWDGLGLVSYCLVIYFQNYKSYSAGMLTVLTNRVGDVAILLAIAWMMNFGSWHYIFYVSVWDSSWMMCLVLLIVLAGFTKSAQIPFSSWLPAAMAAPTPVSALVHSSTLVTAGVYLLIRFSDLLKSIDCSFFLLLSMMTMFMAGLGANFEYDLKKIIALSTLSQLGLMMSILFIGYPILAFFHLLTHAFFKALLFLCAGLMIHCMSDSQDIRHMGVMVNHLPFTCACFLISNFSLCGLPFMSGFYSKDIIIEMMSYSFFNLFIFIIFFLSVGLTVSYSIRLLFFCLSFNMNSYVCQSYTEDGIMMKSMILLSFLAIFGGSVLSWLLFNCPTLILFPLYLKFLPLVSVLLGGWMGYEFSMIGLFNSIFFLNHYSFTWFLGSMWFMPMFSTFMLYDKFFVLSKKYDSVMDSGWGEYMISSGPISFFSGLSKILNLYQFNNVKVFMLMFIMIYLFSVI
uniref:NADH dehydrogenase subunit 5 n=1 Tax=Sclomina xingrensis TaxID=2930961 RepID=UPI002551FF9B|nr:NADH dehydrogenase subunit 5 [Sclomina xingrensis]WGT89868.1 NADH dehydrogenase subunit 5 [Sclomina xingrensis]WGT89881.1 NADH dehydrogenase subunit 5 [Sclomina xingrensis]WGT89894.1 NADH dehydrogenase subunit 5 [Sclomina xingrensis]WGT89907.1 NADH dehydrogenase subunit 5 [Sclomina xingrensis]WGT89920.1 NADH dehydrogenase subunit 5 [Sclomina xingrensis]